MNTNYSDKLQSVLTGFIDHNPKLPAFAPAFIMDGLFRTVADDGFNPITDNLPFNDFWIAYESNNPPFGTVTNIVLVKDRVARLWTILHGVREKIAACVSFHLDDPQDYECFNFAMPRAVLETLPEIRLALANINNNDQETATHPALKRLNANRHKAHMKKIAPFIIVKQTRRAPVVSIGTGDGSPKSAHNRRGHWRTLTKNDKRVWVKDCAIHGGRRHVARDYRVKMTNSNTTSATA